MILYTMMPENHIFPTSQEEYAKQKVIYYNGIPLLVKETETKEYEIIRNLSTNPRHFLEEKYAPGVKLPHIFVGLV